MEHYVFSFYLTYVLLLTTATITFIEAMRTKNATVQHIMNLETCISLVATFFYSKFVGMLEDSPDGVIDYKTIHFTRYLDWSITTPMMLLVLLMALRYNSHSGSIDFTSYGLIVLLNFAMLWFGYLGEIDALHKPFANASGFLCFFGLCYFIYSQYVSKKYTFDNYILFSAFFVLWSCYGLVYFLDDTQKNIMYNILDLFAKCFMGIFFWAYYTKIFSI
jgi:bacteriorhodopsin